MTIKKRGRPAGVKNKTKSLEKKIADWDAEPRTPPVDYQKFAQKLQNALAAAYVEIQSLEKDIEWFSKKDDVREAHLEIKQRHIDFLELDLAHRKAKEEGLFRNEDEDSSI
jgi:hypothetical protein